MNDERTPEGRYQAWVDAVNKCHTKGWVCVEGWVFKAPNGTEHDLSCADLDRLDYIEKTKCLLL